MLCNCTLLFVIVNYSQCFDIIAMRLHIEDLCRFGVNLGLEFKDVDEIQNSKNKSYYKVAKVLDLWHQKAGAKADIHIIIGVLRHIDKVAIAEELQDYLDHSRN